MSLVSRVYPALKSGGYRQPPLLTWLARGPQRLKGAIARARFSNRLLAYVSAMLLIGVALTAGCLVHYPLGGNWQHWLLWSAFVLLMAVSDRYGLHLTHGTRVHVDTIPLFAGVLVFDPASALLMAGLGRVLGRLDRSRPLLESLFNLGQTLVYVGTSSLLLHTFTTSPWVPVDLGAWAGMLAAALAMFALNSAAVVGIVHLQTRAKIAAIWRAAAPQVISEHAVMFGFGLLVVLVVVPYPWSVVLVALPAAAVFVLLDRTLKTEARQTRLAEQNARLAEDLSHQADELRESGAVLKDALAAKNQMLQNVSHELRTPMVSITGYTEALVEGMFGELSSEQRSVMEIVSRSTWTMVRLVDDLLALQALDRKGMALRPVRLDTLYAHCSERHAARAQGAQVELRFKVEASLPEFMADESRLEQGLSNVIDNAIKFSPDGGDVVVAARLLDAETVQISVQDHGIGIPAEELSRIYRSFYQVDGSSTRRFSGQGLGLAITKRIVELHEGAIWAESQVGAGSTFFINLPVRPAESMQAAA